MAGLESGQSNPSLYPKPLSALCYRWHLVVKNMLVSAGDLRDMGSVPGSGRSPGGGMANHSSILAWKIPWTKEPGGL